MDERKEEAKATRCLFCMYFAHILGVKLYKWWVGGMTATVKKKEYPMRVVSSVPIVSLVIFSAQNP